MATSYVTIGSKFRPFSYDELVRPLQEATVAHQALETEYADLDTKASVWENIANEQTDPKAYQMYKRYSEDLKSQADALASQGLTQASRQNLLKMKGRYSQEITPIEQAYTRRRQLTDEQRKALAEDPTLMYQRDASTMSLDDFIANPEIDYGASYSGALLTQQVSTAASNLKREMRENPRKWRRILGNQYYETLMQTGFTSDEINLAIIDPDNANPILTRVVDDVISSSGIWTWADRTTKAKARAFANQGLWGAIGESKYETLKNWMAEFNERDADSGSISTSGIAINPLNIYSPEELDAHSQKIKDYSKYFDITPDGKKAFLNDRGKKELKATQDHWVSAGGAGSYRGPVPSNFKNFTDELLSIYGGSSIEDAWLKFTEDNPQSKYDASKVTEFDYAIDSTQQNDMKNAILTATSGNLKEVSYDSKSKTFKSTGKELKLQDLNKEGYSIVSTRFSPFGSTVMIKNDKGEVKRYELPKGINTQYENERDVAMYRVYNLQNMLTDPSYNLNPQERAELEAEYKRVLQEAYMYHSQLGVRNKTKEQEFGPYGI